MALLRSGSSVLLVVDLQERLMPAITGGAAVLENTALLVRAAVRLGVDVRATEQNPRGLGPTVAEIAELLPRPAQPKTTFAAGIEPGPGTVVVAGCEAHVCVLQTALGLRERGREVAVVADAAGSRVESNRDRALERLRAHGVDVVTAEMVVFEWLHDSDHPAFREVLELIR
ncbi:isochorismatase family protein [Saccharopolyspora rhizosphaerae]|uniref:Isochorismatase family protein n=1 Tax=Saccharopolyspora rhizosphaerae TaxID=2492662 RepID=A0A426K5K4_9PSEU|nr:isochorismatase family protein [Saccharopolyspora rhizosphaerae]RRO20689.1 isochorismatase family protein [Saccharopolyspora rhizosphaerae]